MIATIIAFILNNPYMAGAIAAVGAVVVAYFRGSRDRAKRDAARQAKADKAAADDRLEMHREATAEELKQSAKTDADALKEAMKWAKPR